MRPRMLQRARNHLVAWLIERHPRVFLRWKKIGKHRLGEDAGFLRAHAHLVREFAGLQRFEERYNLWALARSVARLPGGFAEVGVCRGGSARILCAAKDDAPFHLFDTFGGMPDVDPATDGAFRPGDFADCSVAQVRAFLAGFENLHFHPGIFPASAAAAPTPYPPFKFVHLDVDLHRSTLDALAWFYPRLVRGGLLVTHDYGDVTVPGVKQAFDEFFADKPETVIPLWFSQAVVTKL
ncbi:MAG: hypothetical protein B9S34_08920 [Opitutia bacterium Tous-C1TDCM]|nr:MAG: hypothetical protein B9S34_08920 [Opitutae bacterium Tous-C1TDCM]